MKIQIKVVSFLAGAAASLLLSGCDTAEMKGTPFYSGEATIRKGPSEQRVNAWPIFYYRDPALSVLWPIFEKTDDHAVVRPLFSVYGLDQTNRDYNILWPFAEFDFQAREFRIFPAYWGDDYQTLFPLFWHERNAQGSSFVSLPWMSSSKTNGANWQLLTPLYFHESASNHSAIVTPIWAEGHTDAHDWRAIIPFAYWDRQTHTVHSPLWAHWKKQDDDIYVAPWLLSWAEIGPKRTDIWFPAALARASWGAEPGPHYIFPLYYRDADNKYLITPFFGWDKGNDGFFYPFTPLVGEWTGDRKGSWVFPLYSHSKNKKSGDISDNFLLVGGHSTSKAEKDTWFFPLFSYTDYGPKDAPPETGSRYVVRGKEYLFFPGIWHNDEVTFRPQLRVPQPGSGPGDTNALLVKSFDQDRGAWPLWSYEHKFTPAENIDHTDRSFFLWLYDYKHEIDPSHGKSSAETNDYTRARILWRVWHYERLNGDVSVDAFPGFTFDHKKDGFKKTSLMWRLFRYERSPSGAKKMDVLFVPVLRKEG